MTTNTQRKIIHVDMDAFYVGVEVLDNPRLKGRPLVVGGDPNSRAVVCSASYEARKFGVRSAIPCSQAKRLCPAALFIRPRFPRYREVSREVHAIFRRFTDVIQPLSIDEAWLDVTENSLNEPSATRLAQQIKETVKKELNLVCSAGVSYNKFLAKIASDEDKPDGLFVITPAQAHDFLMRMSVRKIPGVGRVMHAKLKKLGIEYGAQLHALSELELVEEFGKMGRHLYRRIRGIDERPVVTEREAKSVSVESTFASDLIYGPPLRERLEKLIADLDRRLDKKSLTGKTLTLKVKFFDFQQITRSVTSETAFSHQAHIARVAFDKLQHVCEVEFPQKAIRLLGIGISNFESSDTENRGGVQLELFPRFFTEVMTIDEQIT